MTNPGRLLFIIIASVMTGLNLEKLGSGLGSSTIGIIGVLAGFVSISAMSYNLLENIRKDK